MSLTNFQKVDHFNKTFGVTTHNTLQKNIFDKDPKLVQLRLDLITEEVQELKDAIKEKDMNETIDALTDILYVVYGAGSSFGINLDKSFDIVHESNMSKLCRNEEVAKETVEWYKKEYEEGRLPYDTPAYRKDDKSDKYIVYNESTGKIIKSREYNAVNFSKFKEKIDNTIKDKSKRKSKQKTPSKNRRKSKNKSEEEPSVKSEEKPPVKSEEEPSVKSEEEPSVKSEEEPSVKSEEETAIKSEEEEIDLKSEEYLQNKLVNEIEYEKFDEKTYYKKEDSIFDDEDYKIDDSMYPDSEDKYIEVPVNFEDVHPLMQEMIMTDPTIMFGIGGAIEDENLLKHTLIAGANYKFMFNNDMVIKAWRKYKLDRFYKNEKIIRFFRSLASE